MNDNKADFTKLAQEWAALNYELKKNQKIKFESFEKVFTETFSFLKEYSDGDKIAKEHIDLIVNAYLFANADSKYLDSLYRAVLVLTERMLNAVINNSCSQDDTIVYILEAHEEIHLNFNNVKASVNRLSQYFEINYWKND